MLQVLTKIIEYWLIATVFMGAVTVIAIAVFETAKWVGFRLPVVRPILIFLSERYKARKKRKEKERRESEEFWKNYQQQHAQTDKKGVRTEDVIAAAACVNMMRSNRPGGNANVFDRKFPFFK